MINCKNVLKEIAVNGTAISAAANAHAARCETCAAALKEEAELENCLLKAVEVDAPGNLKSAVLAAASRKRTGWTMFPVLGTAIRTVAATAILIFGFSLGLQMANGSDLGARTADNGDIDLSKSSVYNVNTRTVEPGDLGWLYLNVIGENAGNVEGYDVQ